MILNRDLESTEQKHDYDIVEGPVADDKVQRHITKYLNGEISRTEFFYQKPWQEIYELLKTELKKFTR